MATAQAGDTVAVHYKGELTDGTVFDTSFGRDPLEFTLGTGNVIPGFERIIVGMTPGESKTDLIPADQAYGPYLEERVLHVERAQIPSDVEVEVGQELEIADDQGHTARVTIADLNDETITLDANHMLAGKDLKFTIELVSIL